MFGTLSVRMRRSALAACALLVLLAPLAAQVPVPPLPRYIVEAGVIRVGSQETYVPCEFRQVGDYTVTGYGAELLREVARRLGVKLEYVHAEYAALIPGLQANRFDMGSGGMSPNPSRLEMVEMVGYFQSGAVFIVRAEDEGKYKTAQDFSGKTVGYLQGSTTLEAQFQKEDAALASAGKPPIKYQKFQTTPDGLNQLLLGRIDAYTPDMVQRAYYMSITPGKYAPVGANYFLTKYPTVWTFRKNDKDALMLRDAVVATLTNMIADGTYRAILDKWGVTDGAVKRPGVNSLTVEQ